MDTSAIHQLCKASEKNGSLCHCLVCGRMPLAGLIKTKDDFYAPRLLYLCHMSAESSFRKWQPFDDVVLGNQRPTSMPVVIVLKLLA